MSDDIRSRLDALIRESGEDYSSVSRLLGRNAAYIQQFIRRGTPRRLAEADRRALAAYFRISEEVLGGPATHAPAPVPALVAIARVEIGASAGPGGIAEIEERGSPIGFDGALLRDLGVKRTTALSIIRVAGDSMEPTLQDGDDILVDRGIAAVKPGAIHVLRYDDMLLVKRLRRAGGGGYLICSDNPAHPDIPVSDPGLLQVVGRVLWCGRRLA